MNRLLTSVAVIALSIPLLTLGGCGTTPLTQFYVLTPMANASQPLVSGEQDQPGPSITVQRVQLPQYLDRPQIVTRTSRNTVVLAEFDHWTGSLDHNVTAVLVENLSTLIPTNRITALPKKVAKGIDYEVSVEIIQFEKRTEGPVTLNARWHIISRNRTSLADSHSSRVEEAVNGKGYEAIVGAMNRALDELSREISNEIADRWRNRR